MTEREREIERLGEIEREREGRERWCECVRNLLL